MEIEYSVRNLRLFEAIDCSDNDETKNGHLYICTTCVTEKMLEPAKDDFIIIDEQDTNKLIPAGAYFFVQGVLFPSDKGFPLVKEVKDAAEQLWLEFLWQEKKPADSIIYLRVLKEEHGFVFQLMRSVLD